MRGMPLLILLTVLTSTVLAQTTQPNLADQAIAAMGDNTWIRLRPTREPAQRSYCGPALGGGLMFYFGGDPLSHEGNDVELYDLAANNWSHSWNPQLRPDFEPDVKPTSAEAVFDAKTGRPWPVRTFQQACYLPKRKTFLLTGHIGTWEFDPAANKWSNPAGPFSEGAKFSPNTPLTDKSYHTFYSPQLDAAICMLTARPFGVYLYDPDRREWRKRPVDVPRMMQWYELYSTYVPTLNGHVISQAGRPFMWLYDPLAERFTEIKDVPEEIQGTQAIGYDAANDAVIALEQFKTDPDADFSPVSVDVWVMPAATQKWSKLERAATDRPAGFATGSWAPLHYDAARNVFLFVNSRTQADCETWAYRYKRANR